jgi:prolipoprotein diacylglyceryl transferase
MSVAYLPSPGQGVWHLGPVPVRGYALCAILGVVAALWLTDRRYRRMGGPRGMIFDVATYAVPAGIIGARLYGVLTDYRQYFGPGRDWVSVFRIWDGGLGTAGMVGAGAIGAWIYCRRSRYSLGPMALAAAPAVAVAQAIGTWGNWFNQRLYGAPSTLPWAVAISPERRAHDYESFATFQPVFLYESLWDLLIAVAVAYAIRRFLLTGDRAFAVYAGLYAAGRFTAELLRIDTAPRLLGIHITELTMLVVVIGSMAYLAATRTRRGQPAAGAAASSRAPAAVPAAVTAAVRSAGPAAPAAADPPAAGPDVAVAAPDSPLAGPEPAAP